MKLSIVQRQKEGIEILDLNGSLTVGDATTALREKLQELAAANRGDASCGWSRRGAVQPGRRARRDCFG